MGVAALINWLVTALFGGYLVAVWLADNDVTRRGGAASRLPVLVILGHALLVVHRAAVAADAVLGAHSTTGEGQP